MKTLSPLLVLALCSLNVGALSGCAVSSDSADTESVDKNDEALTGNQVSALVRANLGKGACSTNSLGGHAYDSSCTGNGGAPEYWCADFARWAWASTGAQHTGELTAAAGSFYTYGENHGTLSHHPTVGAAVVFNYHGGGRADHVAIVSQVNADGTIETVSGDWNGQSGSEAHFSSTSHVVLNAPAYHAGVGTTPGIMGMTISGFIAPVGESAPAPPPKPPTGCGIIDPGHALTPGETRTSCNGHFDLAMQTDGNLVLYHHGVGATWASNTYKKGGHRAAMQTDGNFVLYNAADKPLWSSGTWGHPEAYLAIQDDGNLVVYVGHTPLWDSHTNGK